MQADLAKVRSEIEARNTKLNAELDKFKKAGEEGARKLAYLQSLYDKQSHTISLLEAGQEKSQKLINEQEVRLKQIVSINQSETTSMIESVDSFFSMYLLIKYNNIMLLLQDVLKSQIEQREKVITDIK